MTFSQLGMVVLHIRLALMRFGLSKSVSVALFMTGLIVWFWGIPNLQEQHSAQRKSWLSAQEARQADVLAMPAVQQTTAEENFNHFTRVLGDPLGTEKQIKILFALARKTGLTLTQAEYKFAEDKNGRYRTYQILLPVKGSYDAIRQFCEKSLLVIPFASLDEMSFKRETITSGTLEARLRFTLYLSESSSAAGINDNQNIGSVMEAS